MMRRFFYPVNRWFVAGNIMAITFLLEKISDFLHNERIIKNSLSAQFYAHYL